MTLRTVITIGNPDEGHHIELKGDIRAAEAIHRAKHIVRAQPRLDHTERGYLISCINNGNYAITHETTE
jgi:hypothetical protein